MLLELTQPLLRRISPWAHKGRIMNEKQKGKIITFHIRRYDPEKGGNPYWQSYPVPFTEGMTILDGLHSIRENMDPTLVWRYSCRMGICGSCAMLVNSFPVLACNTQVSEVAKSELAVAPLPNFDTIKDLVPDLSGMFEKHRTLFPYILREDKAEMEEPTGEFSQSPEELEAYLQFSFCIRCGACMAACPTLATDKEYLGPMPIAQGYRYSNDRRDYGFNERKLVVGDSHGAFRCHFGSECSRACPKGVDPAKAIQLLKRQLVFNYLRLYKQKKPCGINTEPRTTGKRESIPDAPAHTVEKE